MADADNMVVADASLPKPSVCAARGERRKFAQAATSQMVQELCERLAIVETRLLEMESDMQCFRAGHGVTVDDHLPDLKEPELEQSPIKSREDDMGRTILFDIFDDSAPDVPPLPDGFGCDAFQAKACAIFDLAAVDSLSLEEAPLAESEVSVTPISHFECDDAVVSCDMYVERLVAEKLQPLIFGWIEHVTKDVSAQLLSFREELELRSNNVAETFAKHVSLIERQGKQVVEQTTMIASLARHVAEISNDPQNE